MDPELFLIYFNIIASCFGVVALCFAVGQFLYVEYKLHQCKQKLYKENITCIYFHL